MNKFLLVNLFDPQTWDGELVIDSKPFWINTGHISEIIPYDPRLHSVKNIQAGAVTFETPEGALESVYVRIREIAHHLDVNSSKKLLKAIER